MNQYTIELNDSELKSLTDCVDVRTSFLDHFLQKDKVAVMEYVKLTHLKIKLTNIKRK